MAKYIKGQSGNLNGRPKGSTNKATTTIRNWIVDLINGHREQIEADFEALEPEKRLLLVEKLLPYIMPKALSAEEVRGACYDVEDVEEKYSFDIDLSRKAPSTWIERTL